MQSQSSLSPIAKTIHSLKLFRRFVLYSYQKSRFPKPKVNDDQLFPFVKTLRQQGYVQLKPDETVHHLPAAKNLLQVYEKLGESSMEDIIEADKKNAKPMYRKNLTPLFDRDLLLEYASSPFLIENIQQYFGFKPHLRYIGVWLDHPTKDGAISTQLFHRDPEDLHLVKTFLYLKNVSEENGPFCFVTGSHRDPWNSFSKIVHSDEDIAQLYSNSSVKKLSGPAGSLIMADTNGFHKGLKPVAGYRVLLTVYFSSDRPRDGHLDDIFEPRQAVPVLY
ncbi:MAG: hypothetical protein COT73_06095 [Bdellovibrio sp. CG10_big_fil_rev_8_21_14_0_10_47_8]|nr:MAG: hypothetical protein COT73_06095 [Bdellovibrio sp. CG10_big_fil_rev_8_21_14_0_10_47_8]